MPESQSRNNRLAALRPEARGDTLATSRRADQVAEAHGFVDRGGHRGGRKPSPRTFQLHPKVLPEIGQQIVDEAERLGTTQGHLLERMWAAYTARQGD